MIRGPINPGMENSIESRSPRVLSDDATQDVLSTDSDEGPVITREESDCIKDIIVNNHVVDDNDVIQDHSITSSSPIPHATFSISDVRSDNSTTVPLATNGSKGTLEKESGKTGQATLLDYVYSEIRRGYILENDEQRYRERREKFYIFMKIPVQLEKFLWYGFFQCADAFLFVFTLLPIRFFLAIWFTVSRSLRRTFSDHKSPSVGQMTPAILQPAEVCDLLKGSILIISAFLMGYVDTSMLYHIIKSQSVIKLYIFFNMLEVADKLFSSFGQDILDALFWTATEPRGRKRDHLGVLPHLAMASGYVFLHTLLVLLQATTLNVAINSKNKALLTIMMSNNFVELKGMVFKKFEKGNLFHMSCSDVRERFHYLILLFVVMIQTLKEYNWSESHFYLLLTDSICIMCCEILVDWLKHAFVTRFNEITPEVYGDYSISLAYDLASSKLKSAFSDHSDIISRRMGFIPLPLGVLVYRVITSSLPVTEVYGLTCLFLGFLCLSSLKCWINILLLGQSCELIDKHRATLEKRAPLTRTCTSLPSSRHQSLEDIHKAAAGHNSQSTPHTPTPSQSSSLADITAQAAILQDSLDTSMILSDSQVSLVSLEQMESRELKVLEVISENQENMFGAKGTRGHKSILRQKSLGSADGLHKRRVSLQEGNIKMNVTNFDPT